MRPSPSDVKKPRPLKPDPKPTQFSVDVDVLVEAKVDLRRTRPQIGP